MSANLPQDIGERAVTRATKPVVASKTVVARQTVQPLDAHKVRTEANVRAYKIFTIREKLESILDSHQEIIHRRWLSKSNEQRAQLLVDAWPGIPASHRPDFEALSELQGMSMQERADRCLFPFMNLEDLTKTRPLLLLINARGRNQPEAFAMADACLTDRPRRVRVALPRQLGNHTMLFRGRTTPTSYAQLVCWDDYPEARTWIIKGLELQPGVGLQVLRIQQRLLTFCLDACIALLHDVDLTVPYPVCSAPTVPPSKEPLSLIDQKIEDSYRLPSAIDLAWLESLFAAEVNSFRDHLLALREDPAYFADVLTQHQEHSPELFASSTAKPTPSLLQDPVSWASTLHRVVSNAHEEYEDTCHLYELLTAWRQAHDRYADELDPATPLPEELLAKISRFEHSVRNSLHVAIGQFQQMWPASPPVRKWCTVQASSTNPDQDVLVWLPGALECPSRQRLITLIQQLGKEDTAALWGLEFLLDELEYFIERDPVAKEFVSPQIARMLATMGILFEGVRQVNLFQPWSSSFKEVHDTRHSRHANDRRARFKGFHQLHVMQFPSAIVRLAMPTNGRFYYPTDKQRTKQVVEDLRKAERNLDTLWAALDETIVPIIDAHPNMTALRQYLGKGKVVQLQRTPEWVDEGQAKQLSPSSECQKQWLTDYYFELEHRSGGIGEVSSSLPVKTKKKTKGVQGTVPTPSHDIQAAATSKEETPQSAIYRVPRRALRVFQTILFTPDTSSQLGQVPWKDFVDALRCVGFEAQKMRGSSWRFSSPHRDTIHFHEPHPEDSLSFWTARRYGLRLTRRYGWHAGLFALSK